MYPIPGAATPAAGYGLSFFYHAVVATAVSVAAIPAATPAMTTDAVITVVKSYRHCNGNAKHYLE